MLTSMLAGVGPLAYAGQIPSSATAEQSAGSTLPSAQPTAAPAASMTTAVPVRAGASPARPQARLDIDYTDGKLTVEVANTSLNQVLRAVSQKTGMKITGTASEESVFGQYGPSPAGDVLASLLEGTGSNMLLVDNHAGPAELVLTPRRGNVTPPNSSASLAGNDSRDQAEQQQYVPPVRPFQPPVATGRGPIGTNADGSPAFGQPNLGNPGDLGSGEGPKTPQQIYEQLQSLGAQQQASPQD